MSLRKIDQLMVKIMQGDPLTEGERVDVVRILAAWDAAQRRDTTGRPAVDRSHAALHYWALRDFRREKAAAAALDVGRAWKLSARRVREIADQHRDDSRHILAAFMDRPDAFIRSCEVVAALAEN